MAGVRSGTLSPGGGYQGRSLSFSWSLKSQSIAGNYSIISCVLSAVGGSAEYYYHHSEKLWVYGAWRHYNTTNTKRYKGTIASFDLQINHDANGVGSFGAEIYGAIYYSSQNVSGSNAWRLPDIPRVSDIEIDKDTVAADGISEVVATATKKATSFTDVLTVTLGDYSQEVESGVAFSMPMEWINAISGTSAKATVEVETFNDGNSIGTDTTELTITVPESVVPVINNVDITEAVAAVTNAFGNRFVQNLSQLNVDVDASGVYGSTIKSYSTTLDGVNYIQQAFTSNVIKTAGTLDIKVKITDSRGRSAEETVTVDIVEYVKPTITSMVYIHCDSDGAQNSSGECTKVTIAGIVYPVENQNTKALKLKYKSTTEEVYTERTVTLSDWTFSVDVIINDTDPTVTYEYIAELTDKINADSPETFRVTTGIVVLSRKAGGTGVTIGGEAERDGFVVANGWDALFTGDLFIELDDETLALWEEVFGTSGGGSTST